MRDKDLEHPDITRGYALLAKCSEREDVDVITVEGETFLDIVMRCNARKETNEP